MTAKQAGNEHLTAELEELAAEVRDVGVALREARAQLDDAITEARRIAVRAYRAGMSEVDIARELHVDRARTLRRWLGKRHN